LKISDTERFEALKALEEQSWKEFQEKSKLELKMTLTIWLSLLLSLFKIEIPQDYAILFITLLCILGFIHYLFLDWIYDRLKFSREYLINIRKQMFSIVDFTPPKSNLKKDKKYIYLQFGVSVVLISILIIKNI
jgi:hypothetical protein